MEGTTEATKVSNLLHQVNVCLKNKQVFVKNSSLNGIMALSELIFNSQLLSRKETNNGLDLCNWFLPYVNKMLM